MTLEIQNIEKNTSLHYAKFNQNQRNAEQLVEATANLRALEALKNKLPPAKR